MCQQQKPMPGTIYTHFKEGNKYQIVTLAKDSETGEEMVVYQALYGEFQVYVRPLSMFLEILNTEKYPMAKQKHRFEENTLHPDFLRFLEADTNEKRLDILKGMKDVLDDTMINSMAVVLDVTVKDGRLEDRYEELIRCIQLKQQYETNRFR